MRFAGVEDAYGWYRARRFELQHPGAFSRRLYHARGAADAVIALADLERLLVRLGRAGQKALKERNSGYSDAAARFEALMREADYLQ